MSRTTLALGAEPVTAGVVSNLLVLAGRVTQYMTPERCTTARFNRRHYFKLTEADMPRMSLPPYLSLGAEDIVEGHSLLGAVGQTGWIYRVLISALVRDIGPIIVNFIVITRSGTAIATEPGNMVVNHEYDALRVMGISPVS